MKRVFIDPDGTAHDAFGVIVEHATGVIYSTQCAGVATIEMEQEGYFVPLGGGVANIDRDEYINAEKMTAVFHQHVGCGFLGPDLPAEQMTELKNIVESIAYWWRPDDSTDNDSRGHLRLDETRLNDLAESWVPVILPDGQGILTWPNCG